MSWKQPIDTKYRTLFGDDITTKWVWIEILLRTRIADNQEPEKKGNLVHYLNKGQCVIGYKELAVAVGSNEKAVTKSVRFLKEKCKMLEYAGSPNGTIVTVNNYIDVFGMGERKENAGGNARSVTRVKEYKSVKNIDKHITKKTHILSGIQPPLTYEEIYKISKLTGVMPGNVKNKMQDVLLEIESGNKYKLESVYLTTIKWVRMGIERGTIPKMNEMDSLIFPKLSPEYKKAEAQAMKQLEIDHPEMI